jgi:hypothetical protein
MLNSPHHLSTSSVTTAEDELALQQSELIKALLVTVQHFFGGFKQMFANICDPRHPAFITTLWQRCWLRVCRCSCSAREHAGRST